MLKRAIPRSSAAALLGLIPHYLAFYAFRSPLLTETISEWIMAHTPSRYAVPLLETLGAWAKPFAMTGALAVLGFVCLLALPLGPWAGPALGALAIAAAFGYWSPLGLLSFFVPVAVVYWYEERHRLLSIPVGHRREFLTTAVMASGVVAVAGESYLRERLESRSAVQPVTLFPFTPPVDPFGDGLVRKLVTPVSEFYGMSKNTVDPAIDPRTWRLKITADGRTLREFTYAELLALPRQRRYVTLRCISNTLGSDLMGNAEWAGIRLSQLIERNAAGPGFVEVAVIGVDGHGDSFTLDYAYSDEPLLALGMNGKTLSRVHGFPLRMLCPRYYGFKNVKWIGEIAIVRQPYFGTWPRLGYTKQPLIHTASHIDRIARAPGVVKAGGVSFAGIRGIRAVEVRADGGPWVEAALDRTLSPYTWTRWLATVPCQSAALLEARALDGSGHWQEEKEGPLFPDGVTGPTLRRISQ